MPEIYAKLGTKTAVGRNAIDRPRGDRKPPSITIKAKARPLADIMDMLYKSGRSAYACAEAQALAKLLRQLNSPINYREIEFNCPTGYDGQELWQLCDNCLAWMAKKSGWGPYKTFSLSDEVLNKLQPNATNPTKLVNDKINFPDLK